MNPFELIGKKLGDYLITRQIAVGGMAVIYLGEDLNLGRQAAVKVLTPQLAGHDSDLPMRFEREARAVAQMEHDNIIPIFQFGQQDGLYFLAMRFVDGQDLNSVIEDYHRDGKLMPAERALHILMQVAQALDYAHAHGVVHRDVKPSNVLLGANDKVYLSDFGLVLRQSVDTTYGTAFGTPRYIAPEQATDSQLATSMSDVYSLAVMVYEIFTGQRLFTGNSPMEVALSHITQTPVPPRAHNPDLPANAQQAILRSLEKDPTRRHPTAQALIADVKRAFDLAKGEEQPLTPKAGEVQIKPEGTLLVADKSSATATPILIDRTTLQDRLKSITGATPREVSPTGELLPRKSLLTTTQGIALTLVFIAIITVGLFLMADRNNSLAVEPTTVAQGGFITRTPAITATRTLTYTPTFTQTHTATPTNTFTQTHTATPTNTPTATITPTATVTRDAPAVGLENPLLLRYTSSLFAIINTGTNPQDIADMRFVGADDADSFQNSTGRLGNTLSPKGCVVIRSSNDRAPADWGCAGGREFSLGNASLFWRAGDESDRTFKIYNGDSLWATCNTVGRAVNNTGEATCNVMP